jgi:hypothetical protein
MDVNPPPRLDLGSSMNTTKTATTAIGDKLDATEREQQIQRTVIRDFATSLDQLVESYKQQEHRAYAEAVVQNIIKYITTSAFAETVISGSPPSSAPKAVSFAGMARTLKNSGADFYPERTSASASSGQGPARSSLGGASTASSKARTTATNGTNSTTTSRAREDRRLLVPIEPTALLNRPGAYALRTGLCQLITGLTLSQIPSITPTKTGWAINPVDLPTRDLLLTQENSEIIMRVLHGTDVRQPETWFNYAVPGIPSTMYSLGGETTPVTPALVYEEALAQTGVKPINCRSSRHGTDPTTGLTTWIVSFTKTVRQFRLFNASDPSKLIDKRPTIMRHNPGCQGFCNPAKCTRHSRCQHCST